MYSRAKRLLRKLFPVTILFKFEPFFRTILYQFYRGKNYRCIICGNGLRVFLEFENGERLCPKCGSSSRDRRLWSVLTSDMQIKNSVVLDFSPSRCLYRKLKRIAGINYYSTDLSADFLSDYHYDITSIDCPATTFDLILCYHILEHIEQDQLAIGELYRVLKPGGTCLVQTPFKEGALYENPAKQSPDECRIHFGQEDHVRIYSVAGLKERLEKPGFKVETRTFQNNPENEAGLSTFEQILVCRK